VSVRVASPSDRWVTVRDLRLHVREWSGEKTPFVLLHGLASNALTWEAVARELNAAGHAVVTVDQRGHGLSDKPDSGYGFDEVTADLRVLIEALDLPRKPIVAGQSWGANVVLDFAGRYPDTPCGLVLVDGGYMELSSRPGATWEKIAVDLRPPNLLGTPRLQIANFLRQAHPDWTAEGIEHTLGNFETLPDGTVRPWLSLDHHMAILRALWEHHPPEIYSRVTVPVLIVPAATSDQAWTVMKRPAVAKAEAALPHARVHWFEGADHDVHVQKPGELAAVMLEELRSGFLCPMP
jgi:pimeloyl-ACP methyl ester carboxylesterase